MGSSSNSGSVRIIRDELIVGNRKNITDGRIVVGVSHEVDFPRRIL